MSYKEVAEQSAVYAQRIMELEADLASAQQSAMNNSALAQRLDRDLAAARDEVERLRREESFLRIDRDHRADLADERKAALAALRRRLAAVRAAVNASCTCGGRGPEDEGVCPACRVWHRWTALEADHDTR